MLAVSGGLVADFLSCLCGSAPSDLATWVTASAQPALCMLAAGLDAALVVELIPRSALGVRRGASGSAFTHLRICVATHLR